MISIQAKNFRSYSELNWKVPRGLTLIDGENGVGKSNLLDAYFWCRYGWLPKWGTPKGGQVDAVIRRGEKKCWVEIEEQLGNDKIKIRRERPHKLQVWKNDILQPSDQDLLDNLLGINANQFLIAVYIPQKRKNSFFHMSDTDRTHLFSVLANLDQLDTALEKCKEKRDNLKLTIQKNEGSLQVLQKQLEEIPNKISQAEIEVNKKELEFNELKKDFESRTQEKIVTFGRLGEELAKDIKELELPHILKIKMINDQLLQIKGQVTELEGQLQNLPRIESSYYENILYYQKQTKLNFKKSFVTFI